MQNLKKMPLSESKIQTPSKSLSIADITGSCNFVGEYSECSDPLNIFGKRYWFLVGSGSATSIYVWADKTVCLFYGTDLALESITPRSIKSAYLRALNQGERDYSDCCFFVNDDGVFPYEETP